MQWKQMQVVSTDNEQRIVHSDHFNIRIGNSKESTKVVPILTGAKGSGSHLRIRQFRSGMDSISRYYGLRLWNVRKEHLSLNDREKDTYLTAMAKRSTVYGKSAREASITRAKNTSCPPVATRAETAIDFPAPSDADGMAASLLAKERAENREQRLRDARNQRSMYKALDVALSTIEETSLGLSQPDDDTSVVASDGDYQLGVALLRASQSGRTHQVCLVFGRRIWRGLAGGVAATTLRIRLTAATNNEDRNGRFEIECSCAEGKNNDTCSHQRYIQDSELVWNRLRSFLCRPIHSTSRSINQEQWSFVKLPQFEKDLAAIWVVFMRDELSITHGRTSATVIVDNRPCKRRTNMRLRVRCAECPAAPGNRWSCIHERICIEQMNAAEAEEAAVVEAEAAVAVLAETENDALDAAEQESSDDELAPEQYISFFACPSEDRATIELTAEILDWNITPVDKREEAYPFVGIDMNAWCRT